MITIRYKSVVINGLDRTNRVETLPDAQALQLVNMGYAEILREEAVIRPPELRIIPAEKPLGEKPRRKKRAED